MSNLTSLEFLLIKQTCRFFAHKFELPPNPNESPEDPTNIYSYEFLKALHDRPKEKINRVISFVGKRQMETSKENEKISFAEKKILLQFVRKVVEMKSQPAKLWTDLQHYLCFVYRYCMTSDPDPEQEILSPYFIADMRSIVCSLMEEDQIQLCLRLFSLVREYTVFAHKQHQKNTDLESSIESLFYYYEAFLSATKNLCKIFPELEKLLINTYKLGWLDFNTSIFMYYFYETPYVQEIVRDFEQMKDNVSIKAAGIYTVLTELHKLWRSQMLGINSVIANKLGAKFKGLGNKMMSSHKRILSKNFWIDRSQEEKAMQDIRLFDCQLFTLVGNRNITVPEPTLDDSGQCVCEDCLIIKYNSILENSHNKMSSHCMKVSCRFCRQQVDLDHFQQHINAELDGNNCNNLSRIISNNIDIVKLGMTANSKHSRRNGSNHDFITNSKRHQNTNGSLVKDPIPKLASEPPIIKSGDEDDDDIIDVTKIPELEVTKMSRKTFYNFLKYRNSLVKDKDKEKKSEPVKPVETPPIALPSHNVAKQQPSPKAEESPKVEVVKSSKATNTLSKNTGVTFPCGHSCKLEEELKSEFKKAYQDTCDHHKESKKCDCTFCEVFGTTTPHVHKSNETRNRLRIRLNQRNETGNCKIRAKVSLSSTTNKTNGNKLDTMPVGNTKFNSNGLHTPPKQDEGNGNPLINDIHGLLNYIEGNTNIDKLAVAEKKAAKKARQRNKKEQERLKLEEEERKRQEEEKRKLEEKIRNEELARQLAEKAAKKEQKKENRKKKQKNKEKTTNNSELVEETIPAMVTIKRLVQSNDAVPTVTITLKGSTADQDKLLYTLVNRRTGGNDTQSTESKKNKKNKDSGTNGQNGTTVNLEVKSLNKKNKNKNDKSKHQENNVIAKEVRLTLAVDPGSNGNVNDVKKNKVSVNNKQGDKANSGKNKTDSKNKINNNNISSKVTNKEMDINIPMLKLPPGITITKVDGPVSDRNYKATNIENHSYNSNIPVSKSGVIVVDTEKLIKQSSTVTAPSVPVLPISNKKSKRKRDKKKRETQNGIKAPLPPTPVNKSSMVTLKNPLFRNIHNNHREPDIIPDMGQLQQAAIFKNENGMVTIRSSRLQQSLNNGTPMQSLMPDLKPTLGPEVPSTYMSSCNFSELSTISPFNAQEILSGLPGIEITKVDKNSTRNDLESKKSCHTAEVSIIPTTNSDKFNFDKDDLHYDNVFTPKDILEDDMDADERELEAFKRFCQQSVPPKRKEKVAHLNVKDIVLKKKNEKVSA